jgi:Na+/H+ antiporter NhaD/arsenite permease-like protein
VEDAIGKVNGTVILFFMGLFLVIGCVGERDDHQSQAKFTIASATRPIPC